jgi:hypothetical protein
MLSAASSEIEEVWSEAKDFAETEFKNTAETLNMIVRLYTDGKIDEERARLHLQFQKKNVQNVLLTIEGLGIIAAERAINAALQVVKDAVNGALDFALI